ncbi:hypothetical protein R5R35_004445 [Gryllus longicercus]|uniref:SWI/SNF complex subunit SMARCC2 n=1 Tax=Gryllus longicercus TaxID=2509291 RepID=A0AAN9VAL0_9ORTH
MMAIAPRNNGGPDVNFFESPETILEFENVRIWVQKNFRKYIQGDILTNKSVATLVMQMIQFQEDNLGKNVSQPPITRIPMRCFLDLKPRGALCHILGTAYKFKSEQGWRRFDFQSPSRLVRHLEMFMNMTSVLVHYNLLVMPIVFIRADVDKALANKIRDIVKRHAGIIAETEERATHIIYPPCEQMDEEYARPIMKWGQMVMLHWFYFPDSHNSWIKINLPTDPPKSPKSFYGPWRVAAMWVIDMEQYNEWMTEEDYEVDGDGKKKIHSSSLSISGLMCYSSHNGTEKKTRGKRHSQSPLALTRRKSLRNSRNAHKKLKGMDQTNDTISDEEDGAVKSNVDPPFPGIVSAFNESDLQPTATETTCELNNKLDTEEDCLQKDRNCNGNAEKSFVEQEIPDYLNTQSSIIIPSYSAWFDYNSIHSVEKRALPEFFNSKSKSKTPEMYLAYRNFMIDTYRLNPTEYLTSTACRRNLAGDACAIMRVHAFLEQWGLINYQVDSEYTPTPLGPSSTSHFDVLIDTPSGLQSTNLSIPQQLSAKNFPFEKMDSMAKYASDVGKNFGLKLDQYAKKHPVLRNKTASNHTRDWTDQETLLLLEGLEMYKDDWNKVSEHVGSRTQDECILHFLRLPIEDPYLEDHEKGAGLLGPLIYQPIPFSQTGNPIMSTVAFLASIVDPQIASCAVKAAMTEFANIKGETPLHIKNVQQNLIEISQRKQFDLAKGQLYNYSFGSVSEKKDEKQENQIDDQILKNPMKDIDENRIIDNIIQESGSITEKKKICQESALQGNQPGENISSTESKNLAKDAELQSAAAGALASAAVKAKYLASLTDGKIKSLVTSLIDMQIKKLEMKLLHFEELESILHIEHEILEGQQQQLIKERQKFYLEQIKFAESQAFFIAQQQFASSNAFKLGQNPHQAIFFSR